MSYNNVNHLLDQQYGFSAWRQSESMLYRLRCKPKHMFTQLLLNDEEEYNRDTPIFACKSATQVGNENYIALANEDGKLAIHDCKSNTRHGITAHNNAIFDLAWMFDQMKIVTASGDHTSKLYSFGDGDIREERIFCGHTRSVKTVAFRKDDSSVFATGSRDGNIIVWDTRISNTGYLTSYIGKSDKTIVNAHSAGGKDATHTPSKSRKKHLIPNNCAIKSVTGLVFQDQNTLISCGAGDGVIKVWDLRKNYSIAYPRKDAIPKFVIPHCGNTTKNGFSNLVIDSQGVRLFANCLDNTIYCYNVANMNAELVKKYTGHQNNTFYIKSSLAEDGRYLVSGSSDESAYIWDTKHSKPIIKLAGHSAEVTCVAWCSKKSNSLITCSDDMSHRIWTVDEHEDSTEANRGRAEILPFERRMVTKRKVSPKIQCTPKKFIWQCHNCQNATFSNKFLCENCVKTSSKRKASNELFGWAKRPRQFGPKRLFGHLILNQPKSDNQPQKKERKKSEDESINLKSLDSALDSFSSNSKRLESPTVNLPNYVLDGVAPHLNYSPTKRKSPDWLTKMRTERKLREEMLERTCGPSTPKSQRLMEPTLRNKKTEMTPKSPLLRFFKITTNSNKCDTTRTVKNHDCNYSPNSGYQISQ